MNDGVPPSPNPNIKSHVVILGAGASRACCPSGDANGVKLPVIADFIATLNLRDTLERSQVYREGEDFETLYSRLAGESAYAELRQKLEREVFNYFAELRLPDRPTIYDHLVLSLRAKDTILTFNWDPFLTQAVARCAPLIGRAPLCLHLHGNVATGYCDRHSPISIGHRGRACRKCGAAFRDTPLLFPVAEKDYTSNPAISRQWLTARSKVRDCFLFTVFGYGAPKTDIKAVELLREAWGSRYDRSMEETEIVDIRAENDLCATWDPFIHTHHYQVHRTFYESICARFPRRSVEQMIAQLFEMEFIEPCPIPMDATWHELASWILPFRRQEIEIGE